MKKISRITLISLMIAFFFAIDKGLGILRQLIVGRQFGLSDSLDVFNAANNLPDMLFALISGGALAIAFIPILSEVLTKESKERAWQVFSSIANLAFLVTLTFAIIVFIFSGPIVRSQIGIAPGFSPEKQFLAIELMRLNLISTMIFSISGLFMASLQANQQFLLPALAPILYDVGQIFGAIIMVPETGLSIGGITLPALGLGVKGLVYGSIIGAVLHLLIQVPGLIKNHFKWSLQIKLKDAHVVKVLKLMGPRVVSMVFIQLIFLAQDNLGSRLGTGAISALTYGWLIMQVPETLIGTAIGTALLPTLSELAALDDQVKLRDQILRGIKVMIALALPISAVLGFGLLPLIKTAFGFSAVEANAVLMASRAFLIGVAGHSLVELAVRAFYAKQNARVPMIASAGTFILYLILSISLMSSMKTPGIALANSIAYSLQAVVLVFLLGRLLKGKLFPWKSLIGATISAIIGGGVVWMILNLVSLPITNFIMACIAMLVGLALALIPIRKELRILMQL